MSNEIKFIRDIVGKGINFIIVQVYNRREKKVLNVSMLCIECGESLAWNANYPLTIFQIHHSIKRPQASELT